MSTGQTHLETIRLRFKNILLATDFSESAERALRLAIAVAGWFGSRIFLLHAVPPVPFAGDVGIDSTAVFDASMTAAHAQMTEWISRPELKALQHEEIISPLPVVAAIEQTVTNNAIDMLVMGSHGASGIEKLALGSVAEAVLRRSRCPVMIAGPKARAESSHFKSILFATDLAVDSLRPAQFATAMAAETNAKLILLHVVEKSRDGEINSAEQSLREQLQSLLPTDAGLWSRPAVRVEHGGASSQILQAAHDESADLIVVGTRERGPLSDHAPWSTVSKIIRGAESPVMAVRAHAE